MRPSHLGFHFYSGGGAGGIQGGGSSQTPDPISSSNTPGVSKTAATGQSQNAQNQKDWNITAWVTGSLFNYAASQAGVAQGLQGQEAFLQKMGGDFAAVMNYRSWLQAQSTPDSTGKSPLSTWMAAHPGKTIAEFAQAFNPPPAGSTISDSGYSSYQAAETEIKGWATSPNTGVPANLLSQLKETGGILPMMSAGMSALDTAGTLSTDADINAAVTTTMGMPGLGTGFTQIGNTLSDQLSQALNYIQLAEQKVDAIVQSTSQIIGQISNRIESR